MATVLADPGLAPPDLARYRAVRGFTERLCEPLATEDYVVQSMSDVSPTKWHLAHTSWFFETFVLTPQLRGYRPLDPAYAFLFNSYYVQAGERHCRAQRGYISRPTVEEVFRYRRYVDEAMGELLAAADEELQARIAPLVELGLHHEQQHQELLLTDIKHVFSVNPLRPVYRERSETTSPAASPLAWRKLAGGLHEIGHAGTGFSYDNETPRHQVYLQPYLLADRLVTNGEYLEFMADGGYQRPELWLSLGAATVQEQGWTEPFYWERRDGEWWLFTLSGMRRVDPHEPLAHISYFEADAYARWASARLPTEAEWEVAAADVVPDGNFADEFRFHPAPAGAGDGAALRQQFGDVWEWTQSPYVPYPGFRPAAGALGEYNGKFMCQQYVLRGGSCATSRSHIRASYRNFFPPEATWQFTGSAPGARRMNPRVAARRLVRLLDLHPSSGSLYADVRRGLAARPRRLPPKWFYDDVGAELFDRITKLDEYYPTRTELRILRRYLPEIARLIGPRARVVEFGSGSGAKTRVLLRGLEDPASYLPIDIARNQLLEFAAAVGEEFPDLQVLPVCADYTRELPLPASADPARRTVAFFPGSTIGNFEPAEAAAFLRRAAKLCGPRGQLLIGTDLHKDRAVLERAYNDAAGVTAAFNLNLLRRSNRECGTDFDLAAFRHHAFYDEQFCRIEMRLVARRAQTVTLPAREGFRGTSFEFKPGDYISTEYSHKYTTARFAELARRNGWRMERVWTDEHHWFAVWLLAVI